jgi:transposase-like protein
MARHRRFSFELKRHVVLDVLEERVGLREMAPKHFISRSLVWQWWRYPIGYTNRKLVMPGL